MNLRSVTIWTTVVMGLAVMLTYGLTFFHVFLEICFVTVCFFLFNTGVLSVNLFFAGVAKGKRTQCCLLSAALFFGIFSGYAYYDIVTHPDPIGTVMVIAFGWILALPIMVPLWIGALILEIRTIKKIENEKNQEPEVT